jgi:aminoglycoside phosphotransferase (APT) family kinase protein
MSSPPPATGVRLAWAGLPGHVRAAVEARAGASVVAAHDQQGGFSPGVAARLMLEGGGRLFVKAVASSINPDSLNLYRQEARALAALPPGVPSPRLLWVHDDGDWVVLGIEDVEGRSPSLPWRRDELGQVVAALAAMAEALTPAPEGFPTVAEKMGGAFTGWRTLADAPPPDLHPWASRHLDRLVALEGSWTRYAAGDTLLHFDLRADNLLLDRDGRVRVVDWAHACTGAAWFDLVLLLTEVDHPATDEILTAAGAPPEGVDALLCALAGFFAERCRRPMLPGLPTLRSYQRAYAGFRLRWLARRTGWGGSVWALR